MAMVVIGHIYIHGLQNEAVGSGLVRSFIIAGVNLFVLITGYFGIRLRWHSLFDYASTVAFYTFVGVVAASCFGVTLSWMQWVRPLVCLSTGSFWFTACYFFLMLVSPLLAAGLRAITGRQRLVLLAGLTYLSCFSAFLFKSNVNVGGYCLFQFVYMYVVGDTLRLIMPRVSSWLHRRRWWLLVAFVAFSLVVWGMSLFAGRAFNYNNPAIIAAAVSLFLFFSTLSLRSARINLVASAMFPVYMLQEGKGGQWGYKWLYAGWTENGGGNFCVQILMYLLILYGASFILEVLRRRLIAPLAKWAAERVAQWSVWGERYFRGVLQRMTSETE